MQSINELLKKDDVGEILSAPSWLAGLACSWPYFRLYLLNVVWAVPVIIFRDDWTWGQAARITVGCFGVGFCSGFLASVLYRNSFAQNTHCLYSSLLLASPMIVLPILCVVEDGPEILANYWVAWALVAWACIALLYIAVSRVMRKLQPPSS